jgi:sporulation protein YlmC with PRC-barrel domain
MQMTEQILSQIVEGMDVYDSDGARVGMVVGVRLGEGDEKTKSVDIVTMADAVNETIGKRCDFPTVLFAKLYMDGFIHVNRGLLRRDAIVFPHQIDDIGEESVYLKIEASEVIKL